MKVYVYTFKNQPPEDLRKKMLCGGAKEKISHIKERVDPAIELPLIEMSQVVEAALNRRIDDLFKTTGFGTRERRCIKKASLTSDNLLASIVSLESGEFRRRGNGFGPVTINSIRLILRKHFGLDFAEFVREEVRERAKIIAAAARA